jgi:hypothetical protein
VDRRRFLLTTLAGVVAAPLAAGRTRPGGQAPGAPQGNGPRNDESGGAPVQMSQRALL